MYWEKQGSRWVKDPEDELNFSLLLHNQWEELDDVGPNSYVGVASCFGLHERGQKEHPVWKGGLLLMKHSAMNRKFKLAIVMVDPIVE